MLYKEFEQKYLGKKVDFDKVYWYQCVDLARQYSMEVFWIDTGSFWGSAWSWYEKLWKDVRFSKTVRVKKFNIPPVGAIVFFSPTAMWQPYGHVAICAYAQAWGDKIDVLEQNWVWTGKWTGWDAVRINTYSLEKVAGWILPR